MPHAHFLPQANPGPSYAAQKAEIDAAIARVLAGGRYILGDEVAAFEREFAAWLGVRHAVGVASGTDAPELALRVLKIGPGNAVFAPSHTAVATIAAIERAGARPVLVEVDPRCYTMSAAPSKPFWTTAASSAAAVPRPSSPSISTAIRPTCRPCWPWPQGRASR